MDESSTYLKEEIARLKAEVETVRRESAKYRTARKSLAEELEQTKTALDASKKDAEKLSKKVAELPGEVQAENDRLKGEIRTRDHKGKFAEFARELGADPDAVEAAWKLSGYSPEKDAVDEQSLKDLVSKTLDGNPFLKSRPQEEKPTPKPGPAGGQGQRADNVAGTFRQTKQQAADPVFQSQNRSQIQAAALGGMLITV